MKNLKTFFKILVFWLIAYSFGIDIVSAFIVGILLTIIFDIVIEKLLEIIS